MAYLRPTQALGGTQLLSASLWHIDDQWPSVGLITGGSLITWLRRTYNLFLIAQEEWDNFVVISQHYLVFIMDKELGCALRLIPTATIFKNC